MLHKMGKAYGRVFITPLTSNYLEDLRLMRNKESQWFINSNHISEEQQIEWYNNYIKRDKDYMFEVHAQTPGNPFIGAVALYNHDVLADTIEFGRLIVDGSVTGERGLGLDVTVCACMIAFHDLSANQVYLEVLRENARAIRTYEKVGFSECGVNARLIKMQLSRNDFIRNYGNGDGKS